MGTFGKWNANTALSSEDLGQLKAITGPWYLNFLVYPKIPAVPVRSSTCCFLFSYQKAAIFSNAYVFFAKTGARRKFGNFKTKWRVDCILHLE